MTTNSTNTSLNTSYPSVIFARVNNDLGTYNVVVPENVNIYIINPIDITESLFRKAFYTNNSDVLSYYKPNNDSTSTPSDKAILKNLLFLNSGGGTFVDSTTTPTTTTSLPLKTITFGNGSAEEFIFNSFIIKDIETISEADYNTWSVDSQIDLARKLSAFQYIYDFQIIFNTTSTTTQNTNALTWDELTKTVNTYIYKYFSDANLTIPVTGTNTEVIVSFVASFKAIVDDANSNTPPKETITQVLYQYKITDWTFQTIST